MAKQIDAPQELFDFAMTVSADLPASDYGFDWLVIVEIVVAIIEGCVDPQAHLRAWHRRVNGRFGSFWQKRAASRVAQAAQASDVSLDCDAVAAAVVKNFCAQDLTTVVSVGEALA